ncbi:MAG: hypothetical protein GWN86_19530 [Desulfobacterales bacterium]|nr:hypothetical protein [Desulfobacterales bacterium]
MLEKVKAWLKEHQTQRGCEHFNVLMPFHVMRKMTDEPLKIRGVASIAGIDKNMHIITKDEMRKFARKHACHIRVKNAYFWVC